MTPRWFRKAGRAVERSLDALFEGRFVFWLGALWGQWEVRLRAHYGWNWPTAADWTLLGIGLLMLFVPVVRMAVRRFRRSASAGLADVQLRSGAVSINQLRARDGEQR